MEEIRMIRNIKGFEDLWDELNYWGIARRVGEKNAETLIQEIKKIQDNTPEKEGFDFGEIADFYYRDEGNDELIFNKIIKNIRGY